MRFNFLSPLNLLAAFLATFGCSGCEDVPRVIVLEFAVCFSVAFAMVERK
jgi:hypothetical protein